MTNTSFPSLVPQCSSVNRPQRHGIIHQSRIVRPAISRPEVVQRATSLPVKLEKMPPTQKLFWFRPTTKCIFEEEEAEVNTKPPTPTSQASYAESDEARDTVSTSTHLYLSDFDRCTTFDSNDSTGNHEDIDDLIGLGLLSDE